MTGKFITLEGIDGAGKSSHIEWIAARLREWGSEVVVTREPGGTPLGEKLREILLHDQMDAKTETLLVFAARQEHLTKLVCPALARGAWVISDRFTDATFAYQGGGRGISNEKLAILEEWVQEGLQPHLTLFFDVPVSVGQARLKSLPAAQDRFEREAANFHERVRNAYLARAREFPERCRIIDATQAPNAVQKSVEAAIASL
jgi:dTMP kinase